MPNNKCPKCGSIGKCFILDVSDNHDHRDEYIFFCEKCKFCKREKVWAGTPATWRRPTYCPFCGKSYVVHQEAPPQFITS